MDKSTQPRRWAMSINILSKNLPPKARQTLFNGRPSIRKRWWKQINLTCRWKIIGMISSPRSMILNMRNVSISV